VSILGTDLNRHSLARARQGSFEEWALTGHPEDVKRTCFFSSQGKRWQLAPAYKARSPFNITIGAGLLPSLLNNLSSFD